MAATVLDQSEIDERLTRLQPDWSGTPVALARSIEFADFMTAVRFVTTLAPRCEELDHHPDLSLRWRCVDVHLSTHSAGGVTDKDFQLAEVVDELASAPPADGS
jgi:4a-hydroxytetrahydrobiopterin dehydratase